MKARGKTVNLKEGQVKTLQALAHAQCLTRAQLTVGPLRYWSAKQRMQILQKMIDDQLIMEEVISGRPCPPTKQYVITEKGRGSVSALQSAAA